MRRVEVQLVNGWNIWVDGVQHSGPDVVEVAEDHAAHLVERGVAVEVPKAKARAARREMI